MTAILISNDFPCDNCTTADALRRRTGRHPISRSTTPNQSSKCSGSPQRRWPCQQQQQQQQTPGQPGQEGSVVEPWLQSCAAACAGQEAPAAGRPLSLLHPFLWRPAGSGRGGALFDASAPDRTSSVFRRSQGRPCERVRQGKQGTSGSGTASLNGRCSRTAARQLPGLSVQQRIHLQHVQHRLARCSR